MTTVSEQRGTGSAGAARVGRVRRRLRHRWTAGHVVPVVLAVLAAVFVLVGLRDRAATVLVPVASETIPAGALVTSTNTHLVTVHRSESALIAGLMPSADVGTGWVTTARVPAGEPIALGDVSHSSGVATGVGSMSIPVPLNQADGGAIQVGDQVDVISVSSGTATYEAQGLNVLAVSTGQASGLLSGANNNYWITVAVDRVTALRLAAALGTSSSSGGGTALEVVRSSGEPPPAASSSNPSSPSSAAGQS